MRRYDTALIVQYVSVTCQQQKILSCTPSMRAFKHTDFPAPVAVRKHKYIFLYIRAPEPTSAKCDLRLLQLPLQKAVITRQRNMLIAVEGIYPHHRIALNHSFLRRLPALESFLTRSSRILRTSGIWASQACTADGGSNPARGSTGTESSRNTIWSMGSSFTMIPTILYKQRAR